MKNIFFVIALFYFILNSCRQAYNYDSLYTLESSGTIVNIKIDNDTRNNPPYVQYFNSNDSNYLATLSSTLNAVYIYNLDSEKRIKKITFNKDQYNGIQEIIAFKINDFDTIITISLMPPFIGILDMNGMILKRIPFGQVQNGYNYNPIIPWGGQAPLLLNNIIYLGQIYHALDNKGILASKTLVNTKVCISIDLITGEYVVYPITYPKSLIGMDISNLFICRTLGYNDIFIYNFGIIDSLYLTLDHRNFRSVKIETNRKLTLGNKHWEFMNDMRKGLEYDLQHDEIRNIIYDKYRECYYLVIRKRELNYEETKDIVKRMEFPDCLIIILDKNLKHIGEVNLPDNTYSFKIMFAGVKGLYISTDHINNPTFDEDYMRFEIFNLKKIDENR